jgi:hypothetical protein
MVNVQFAGHRSHLLAPLCIRLMKRGRACARHSAFERFSDASSGRGPHRSSLPQASEMPDSPSPDHDTILCCRKESNFSMEYGREKLLDLEFAAHLHQLINSGPILIARMNSKSKSFPAHKSAPLIFELTCVLIDRTSPSDKTARQADRSEHFVREISDISNVQK